MQTDWKKAAETLGHRYASGQYGPDERMVAEYGSWTILFDTYTTYTTVSNSTYESTYTRIRAPFSTSDDLRFAIYRKGISDSIGKLFGAQDIEIGDVYFDKVFIIKGNDEVKIQRLLADDSLRKQIIQQKDIHLEITDQQGFWGEKLPKHSRELFFFAETDFMDTEQINLLYKLFCQLLDGLHKIGTAKPVQ